MSLTQCMPENHAKIQVVAIYDRNLKMGKTFKKRKGGAKESKTSVYFDLFEKEN